VWKERSSVDDASMHEAQHAQVIVEGVPYQYRIRADKSGQRMPYGVER
jgi:hypothetical protein